MVWTVPYTQLLLDGKALFSSLNGVYGIEQIPAGMIERVEVMRGGGSALYGANAIGGYSEYHHQRASEQPVYDQS